MEGLPVSEGDTLSDEERAEVSRLFWELEDDVAFSRLSSPDAELDLRSSANSVGHSGGSAHIGSAGGGPWPEWASNVVGPAFRAPFVAGHLPAAESDGRLIISLVLFSFAPSLVWMPRDLLMDAYFSFFSPILWKSMACPLHCFGCQLIWYRRLQWLRWLF
ncbi:unnamed protein product [Calypogeia fissa]